MSTKNHAGTFLDAFVIIVHTGYTLKALKVCPGRWAGSISIVFCREAVANPWHTSHSRLFVPGSSRRFVVPT